jgi:hypothetical protein
MPEITGNVIPAFVGLPKFRTGRLRRITLAGLVCLLLCGALAACGKRPAQVDAPPNVEESSYPRIYPDPATDPSPQGK